MCCLRGYVDSISEEGERALPNQTITEPIPKIVSHLHCTPALARGESKRFTRSGGDGETNFKIC